MSNTPQLSLPYLMPSQAQKSVTLNESLSRLDALIHCAALGQVNSLPEVATSGDRYLLGADTGGGHLNDLAVCVDGAWIFLTPRAGWRIYRIDLDKIMLFDGSDWSPLSGGETVDRLGIQTSADDTNRLAVVSDASLFSHAGTDHRMVLNKASGTDTVSLLFQSNWSGRAEIGLAGDNRLSFKTSPDGNIWTESLVADTETGRLHAGAGLAGARVNDNLLINSGFTINQRGFAGGSLPANTYGYDRWRAGDTGCVVQQVHPFGFSLTGALVQTVHTPVATGDAFTLYAETDSDLTVSLFGSVVSLTPENGRVLHSFIHAGAPVDSFDLAIDGQAVTVGAIKLERGGHHSGLVRRPHLLELDFCRYYYEQIGPGPETHNPIALLAAVTPTILSGFVPFKSKRVKPAITFSGRFQCLGLVNDAGNVESLGSFSKSLSGFEVRMQTDLSLTAGLSGLLRTQNDATAKIVIDAEVPA